MARIVDLITDNVPMLVWHPDMGEIAWADSPADGWGLYFAQGPRHGEPLGAYADVLLDTRWETVLACCDRNWLRHKVWPIPMGLAEPGERHGHA